MLRSRANGSERLGLAMEEKELEEGERDDYSSIDSDVALLYIEEKVPDVLGHFQKDFEGEISAEKLGTKFGGYGSFLPSSQRSPSICCQPRSQPKLLSHIDSGSPFNSLYKCATSTPSISVSASFTENDNTSSAAQPQQKSAKKDIQGSSFGFGQSSPRKNSTNRSNNCKDQKTLKLRIKLGSDSILPRNNDDIYSGMGLDISPSSPMEVSPDDSGERSRNLGGSPSETPKTVLQIMTCSPLSGVYLLSPLSDNLLHLTKEQIFYVKSSETDKLCNGVLETSTDFSQDINKVKSSVEKKIGPNKKNRRSNGLENVVQTLQCLNSGTKLVEKMPEKRQKNQNVPLSGLHGKDGGWVLQDYDITKADYDGNKVRNDHSVGAKEIGNEKHARSVNSFEEIREKLMQEVVHLSKGNKGFKGSQASGTLPMDLSKENLKALSFISSEEKKKGLHARGALSENNSKPIKLFKKSNIYLRQKSHKDVLGVIKADQVDKKGNFPETRDKSNLKDANPENEKSKAYTSSTRIGDSPLSKDLVEEPAYNALNSVGVLASCDANVIQDSWVQCDSCQKWRLLPYGTNLAHLPNKWRCKMLNWLPRMNICSISEDETTKALYALYKLSVPESNCGMDVPIDPNQYLDPTIKNVPTIGKRKHKLGDASSLPSQSAVIQISNSIGKTREGGSVNGVKNVPVESDTGNKDGIQRKSRSTEFSTEPKTKPKGKQNFTANLLDGGDFTYQSGKDSKLKSKRMIHQDGHTASKKMKLEDPHLTVKDCQADRDASKKAVPSTGNELSAVVSGRNLQKYEDNSSLKGSKYNSDVNSSLLRKRSTGRSQDFCSSELRENLSVPGMESSNKQILPAKKGEEIEHHDSIRLPLGSQYLRDDKVIIREEPRGSDLRKQKKVKLSKTEGQESYTGKADDRMNRGGHIIRILLSTSKTEVNNKRRDLAGHDPHAEQHQGNAPCLQILDGIHFFNKDLRNAQSSTTATSVSLKVSGSSKSTTNFQEGRASPVESVSSSPSRICDINMLSPRRNSMSIDDAQNFDFISTRRKTDGEAGFGNDQSGEKERPSPAQHGSFASDGGIGTEAPKSIRVTFSCVYKRDGKPSGIELKNGMHFRTSPATCDVALSSDFGAVNDINAVANSFVRHNKHIGEPCELSDKDSFYVKDKFSNHNLANDSTQWKAGNTPGYKWKYSSQSDMDKSKLENTDCCGKQKKFYSNKNGKSCPYGAGTGYQPHTGNLGFDNYIFQEEFGKDYPGKKDYNFCKREYQEDMVEKASVQPEDFNSTVHARMPRKDSGGSFIQKKLQEEVPLSKDEKSSVEFVANQLEIADIEEKIPTADKQILAPHSVPIYFKGRGSETYNIDVANRNRLRAVKQLEKSDFHDVELCNSSEQPATGDPNVHNPIIKDCHTAANVIVKEARNLKHMADSLKNEGQELEVVSIYFKAALKYLHAASLLEPSSIECDKQAEAVQSLQMYSDTAKLLEFCAHGYERCREMASAALAYKCVEVAYFKVAYYKHPIASKDRYELQKALQMALPGDSPSSSASDIDYLNNNSLVDKAAAGKGVSSHIALNHVKAARNLSNVNQWLDYMSETIFAFEASRKARNAILAANVSQEKYGSDGLSSVREVLDLGFYNVQELIRLIRLSMESISL